jgi:hypothetical protein
MPMMKIIALTKIRNSLDRTASAKPKAKALRAEAHLKILINRRHQKTQELADFLAHLTPHFVTQKTKLNKQQRKIIAKI